MNRSEVLSKGQQRFLNGVLVPRISSHFKALDGKFGDFTHDEWKEWLWSRFGSPCGDCAIQAMVDWCDDLDITLDDG